MNLARAAVIGLVVNLAAIGGMMNARAADPGATKNESDQERLERWWDDFEKQDPHASRALLNFADKPDQAVGFIKEKLKPLKIDEDDLKKTLADLASEDDTVWKPAYEKLEYFDPRLTIPLKTLMDTVTDKVPRGRLVEILSERPMGSLAGKDVALRVFADGSGSNFFSGNGSWWAEDKVSHIGTGWTGKKKWTRATRAIILLEHIAAPDATAILKEMATGNPEASPTKAAADSLAAMSGDPGATKNESDHDRLERWWGDLQKHDPEASRAMLNFAAKPDQATAFFKEKLKPLKIEENEVKQLLVDLGSADDTVWKPAYEKLEYFDPRLAIDLQTLMNDVVDQRARNRMVEIISGRPMGFLDGKNVKLIKLGKGEGFNFEDDEGSWWAEAKIALLAGEGDLDSSKRKWTCAVRAIMLLEHIGSPDAIAIIKEMATGHPEASPTRAANDSLVAIGAAGDL